VILADKDWATIVLMQTKADSGYVFNQVVHKYRISEFGVHMDNVGEESGIHTEWEKTMKHFWITQTIIKPHSPWMN